jgi:hypothetical protein
MHRLREQHRSVFDVERAADLGNSRVLLAIRAGNDPVRDLPIGDGCPSRRDLGLKVTAERWAGCRR